MPTLRANGLDFMLESAGAGPPLLFIGGTGWDLRLAPTPLTSPLAERFSVALYDQRGMGRSSKPPPPYSMRDYAADAAALIEALGWARAHVVGYSFGGMVAQELAIGWPDRVDRLVLAATSPGGAGGASYPVHELLDLPPAERARRGLEIADTRFTAAYQEAEPEAAAARVAKRMAAQTRFIEEPGARRGLDAQLDARRRHDCYDRLGDIRAPTLILSGHFDGQAPAAAQTAMRARIPHAVHSVVDGSHNFLFETEDGYRIISDFLSQS